MKTILFPPPRTTTGRFPGLLVKATAALALLGVTAALAGVYQDGEPKPQPPPPAPEPKLEIQIPQADLDALRKMHGGFFHQFQTAPGFGMGRAMRLPPSVTVVLAGNSYQVPKPDLIALETKAIAYVNTDPWRWISMRDLTNRTARTEFQTRAITAAETEAVAELRDGKDIVLRPAKVALRSGVGTLEVEGFRALGAMRAEVGCARCHECAVGTLLGAFSYTLIPKAKLPLIAHPSGKLFFQGDQ